MWEILSIINFATFTHFKKRMLHNTSFAIFTVPVRCFERGTEKLCLLHFFYTGCQFDAALNDYTCGPNGECKNAKITQNFILRYCMCQDGYKGDQLCNKTCGKHKIIDTTTSRETTAYQSGSFSFELHQ